MTDPAGTELRRAAAEAVRHGGGEQLLAAFLAATVYCERPVEPGFVAVDGVVPVFSSLAELAGYRPDAEWFATTGADLLELLPAGYDLVLDLAGAQPVRISTTAIGVRPHFEVGRV